MSSLDALVSRAVVRISTLPDGYHPRGTDFWGSGFFVAPGWVLTCAHVVARGGSAVWGGKRVLGISWDGGSAAGEVALAVPPPADPIAPPRTWPFPDLALVRVPGATDHPCVWLSDASAAGPADIRLHGWSRETGALARRWIAGETRGRDGTDGSALLLRGEEPVAGCSGGPVVDTGRGAVVGVCKGRKASDPAAGFAVAITALRTLCDSADGAAVFHEVIRAHDRHHLEQHRTAGAESGWTDAHSALLPARPGGFGPLLRTHLYGRFAELTPPATPGAVTALVDEVRRRVFREAYRSGIDHDPRSWREGAGLLYDLPGGGVPRGGSPGPLELEAVLLYAAKVRAAVALAGRTADAVPLRELGDWIRQTAEPLGRVVRREIEELLDDTAAPGAGVPAGPRADVLIEIERGFYGDRYPWRVKLLHEDQVITPLHGDERGVPRARLREVLREPVSDALRRGDAGSHLAAVQVALPPELFDEPLDTWRLGPRRTVDGRTDLDGLPLGERRVVVVRDRRRLGTGTPEWRRRWSGVGRGPLAAVPLRGSDHGAGVQGPGGAAGESWGTAYDRLSRAPEHAVPVFCGPVATGDGARMMDAALAAGHPVAIWRRCSGGHTDCAEFHDRAGRLVESAGRAAGLHEQIRSLRIRAGDPDLVHRDADWAGAIALLYDPPDCPAAPGGPLREPGPPPVRGP